MIGVGIILTLPSSAAVLAQQSVVPGRSIGTITLGMARTEAWKHLGRPLEIHFLHVAGRSYTWDDWGSQPQIETVTSYQGHVVQIERPVTDAERRKFLFLSIRRQHPHLKVFLYNLQEEVGAVALTDDRRQGVAWFLYLHHTDDFTMSVFDVVGADKIIVHRRGYAVLPDAGEEAGKHNPLLSDFRAWSAVKPPKDYKGK